MVQLNDGPSRGMPMSQRVSSLILQLVALAVLSQSSAEVHAFQIGVLGTRLESRLTREPDSSLARVAGYLGVLIKRPVHEEITQIAFDCPANVNALETDEACADPNIGYADPFILYGVRWNDLPPFRLNPDQGATCRKFGLRDLPACNVSQTVRFSTQPDCWVCLFRDAQKVAKSKNITGCAKGPSYVPGTLMTRSHFGDLQFLHAMANAEGVGPAETRGKVMDWLKFAWMVFEGRLSPETPLKTIEIPTIREHFGCSEWTISDLYVLGQKDTLTKRLRDVAFGSVVHTIQDSFAEGHVERESAPLGEVCPGGARRPGRIVEFHAYARQDATKHDQYDTRHAMARAAATAESDAIEMTRQLFRFWHQNSSWADVQPFLECVFELSRYSRASSSGAQFQPST